MSRKSNAVFLFLRENGPYGCKPFIEVWREVPL